MERLLKRESPQPTLRLTSPTYLCLLTSLGAPPSIVGSTPQSFAIYSSNLHVIITSHDSALLTPLHDCHSFIAFHETDRVKVVGFPTSEHAQAAYGQIPDDLAKVHMVKPSNEVLASHGCALWVEECKAGVKDINSEFPGGSWIQSSRNAETWKDPVTGKYRLRCLCRRIDQSEVPAEVEFAEGDLFYNADGRLERGPVSPMINFVSMYSTTLLVTLTNKTRLSLTPLHDCYSFVAFQQMDRVRVIGFPNSDYARAVYDQIPGGLTKVHVIKPTNEVLASHGDAYWVEECAASIENINGGLPGGSWIQSSRSAETWKDSTTGKYHLRCLCRRIDRSEVLAEAEFVKGDLFNNVDGHLKHV